MRKLLHLVRQTYCREPHANVLFAIHCRFPPLKIHLILFSLPFYLYRNIFHKATQFPRVIIFSLEE